MHTARSLRLGILAAALATGFAITVAAPAANATVNPANCQLSFGSDRLVADCYNSTNSAWYLQTQCVDPRGHDHTVNGQLRYGSGISIAQCPLNTTPDNGYAIINI